MTPEHPVKTTLQQRIDEFLRDDTTTRSAFSVATALETERLEHLLAGAEGDLRAAQARVAGLKRSLAMIDSTDRE